MRRRFRTKFFGPVFWLIVVSWAGLVGLVTLTDPEIFADYYYLPVWPVTLLALAASLRLILGSWRSGLTFALAGTIYMVFRYLGIGHWMYGVLLLGLAGVIEWYFSIKVKAI